MSSVEAYSNRSKEDVENAEILSQQALQEITDKAVEDVESIKSNEYRHNSEYSSGYKNPGSFQGSNEDFTNSERKSLGGNDLGSPLNPEHWSLNKDQEGFQEKLENLSERDKEILEEFRNVQPEYNQQMGFGNEEMERERDMEREREHHNHHDFRTGSFKQGEEQPYYSEAFSFSKDQVDPDTYPEHDLGMERSPGEYEDEMPEGEYQKEANYVSMGDRDIDIGELSGFQQLKMKNQMMLSTSQIINYHRYVEKRAKKVFSSLLRGYSPVN